MNAEHPNVTLLKRFDPRNVAAAKDIVADDLVWHYFNPQLPEIQGDYVGVAGLESFFERIGRTSGGTFKVDPISATACGDELVVVHARNTLTIEGRKVTTDAVIVWRIVDGLITEAWDIPTIHGAEMEVVDV